MMNIPNIKLRAVLFMALVQIGGGMMFCRADSLKSSMEAEDAGHLVDSLQMEWVDSTRLRVDFALSVGQVRLTTDDRLFVMPKLTSVTDSSMTYDLPIIEFAGKRNRKYFDRQAVLERQQRTNIYSAEDTVRIHELITVEPWMRHAKLKLELARDFEDCCCLSQLPAEVLGHTFYWVPACFSVTPWISVAEKLAQHEPVLVPMEKCEPFNPNAPLRKMKDALYVHFKVSKWDLREDFRNNAETLGRILNMVKQIEADSLSSITRIRIIGQASPEGPLPFNEKLSRNRARVLKAYLVNKKVNLPDSIYEVIAAGEAWADLRDAIVESDLQGKEKLLDIVDHTKDLNRREALLRAHNGGKSFAYLLRHAFADQRNSGYMQICFEAVPDTAAHAINAANKLIREGRSSEAVDLLLPVNDNRKWNTLGSALYLSGKKQEALDCFRKAVEAGNEGARQNLEDLERVMGIRK